MVAVMYNFPIGNNASMCINVNIFAYVGYYSDAADWTLCLSKENIEHDSTTGNEAEDDTDGSQPPPQKKPRPSLFSHYMDSVLAAGYLSSIHFRHSDVSGP